MENLKNSLSQTNLDSNNSLEDLQLSIEDKAAHLSLQVNQVIIKPYLNQALEYLVNSRNEVVAAYNNLSEEIAQETEVLLETNRVLALRVVEAKQNVAAAQRDIRARYSEATEFEIASGVLNLDVEYNKVAENYEKSMQFSQEIVKNRMRVESLLDTQRLLDSSLNTRINEIQLEIDNLTLLLANLHSNQLVSQAQVANNVAALSEFNHGEDLHRTVARLSDSFNDDPSLYTHVQASKVAEDLERLAYNQNPQHIESTVQVDEKDLYVVKKHKPTNLME